MLFPVNVYEETFARPDPEADEYEVDEYETESRLADFGDYTFRELVDLMREYAHPSQYPLPADDGRLWLMSGPDEDYRTGETTYRSIHLMTPDNPRLARYWCKAALIALKHWDR